MKLIPIPKGKFTMGSPLSESERRDEEYPHEVEITKAFYMGVYEVTQEQYSRYKDNTSFFCSSGEGKDLVAGMDTRRFPADGVSWHDAAASTRARPPGQRPGRSCGGT